jgi:tetrahydromethanopterin S-methyltransferase subunit D
MSAAIDTGLLIAMLVLTLVGVVGTWVNVLGGGRCPCVEQRTVTKTDVTVEYDSDRTPILALRV